MADEEPQEPEKKPVQNAEYNLACRVLRGQSGLKYFYCIEEGKFYIYKDNYWRWLSDVELISHLTYKLKGINSCSYAGKKQVLDHMKSLRNHSISQFNIDGWLNFKQGTFSMNSFKLFEHTEEPIQTIRMPYDYKEEAECPLWLKTVNEILEENTEKIEILQEFFGYCLTRDTNKEKALLLLGESRAGKSVILQTMRHLMGERNCSSVPLKFISNPQYTPLLINKLVNIDSDVSGKAVDFEAEFKIITSGEPVTVNQKFIASFEFNPYCKLVMAANEFPRITDHSSAFYKRLVLIPCERVFEPHEQNIHLKKLLLAELPGIFNWAIAGLKRLNERGNFEQKDFMKDAVSDLREESNPTEIFFKDHVVIDVADGTEIEKGELFNQYIKWCNANIQYKLSSVKFAQVVYRKYSSYTPKNVKNHMTQKRIWRNIRLVNLHEIAQYKIEKPQEQSVDWRN